MGVRERLLQVISRQLDVDSEEIKETSSFRDDLNADSFDLVEIVMTIEEEYGIEVPDNVAEKFETIKDVMDYLSDQGVS